MPFLSCLRHGLLCAVLGASLTALGQASPAGPTSLEDRIRQLEARQAELQQSLDALKAPATPQDLAARLSELEKQLQQMQKEIESLKVAPAAAPSRASVAPPGPTPLPLGLFDSTGQVTSGTAFNPAISLITDFAYYRDNRDGAAIEMGTQADGFHGAHAEGGHSHGGGLNEGFNLRETELVLSASVDPYFDAVATLAIGDDGLEAEEVYFQTRGFLPGFQVKGGKFYSSIGYLNKQHPHQWDFVDSPMAYQLLFGGALNEKGLQVNWIPKLGFYLNAGLEVFQGENEGVANYIGATPVTVPPVEEGGPTTTVNLDSAAGPRLFTGFVKVSPEIGYSNALQLGAFFGTSRMHQEMHDEDGDGFAEEALEGNVTFYGADAVFKYDAPHSHGRGDLSVQAEYIYREKDLDVLGHGETAKFKQDALYLQAVYGIAPRLQLGGRIDITGLTNKVSEGEETATFGKSNRYSGVLTFNPTEFSRLRLQYNRGDISIAGAKEAFNQFFVQLQFSIGVHGAHKF